MEKRLRTEKEKEPSRIPYYITVNRDIPGKFSLFYMPGKRPKNEPISVTAEYFRFRGHDFRNLDKLIGWFKVHYKDPIRPQERRTGSGPRPHHRSSGDIEHTSNRQYQSTDTSTWD